MFIAEPRGYLEKMQTATIGVVAFFACFASPYGEIAPSPLKTSRAL